MHLNLKTFKNKAEKIQRKHQSKYPIVGKINLSDTKIVNQHKKQI